MSTPQRPSMESSTSDGHTRKRVCKACDRCRLKKSKCDGASPCSRCRADNAICVFGERKKSHDKVYPKGYVEMLEQQQAQLVAGLKVMYQRLLEHQGWPGEPLEEAAGGSPLTHDILQRLDVLHLPDDGLTMDAHDGFEEDCSRLRKRLMQRGAPAMERHESGSSCMSDHGHDHHHHPSSPSSFGSPDTKSLNEPFAHPVAPPTPPPLASPFPKHAQVTPSSTTTATTTTKQHPPPPPPSLATAVAPPFIRRNSNPPGPMPFTPDIDLDLDDIDFGFDALPPFEPTGPLFPFGPAPAPAPPSGGSSTNFSNALFGTGLADWQADPAELEFGTFVA